MMNLQILKAMKQPTLDELWSDTTAGIIPDGVMNGTVLLAPIAFNRRLSRRITQFAWQGKIFNRKNGTVINRIDGFEAIVAQVYFGPSWYDHAECIVLDYSQSPLRDEIREIATDMYLGKAYVGTKALIYFALEKSLVAVMPSLK